MPSLFVEVWIQMHGCVLQSPNDEILGQFSIHGFGTLGVDAWARSSSPKP